LTSHHSNADGYAYYALGTLEGPEYELIQNHLRDNCAVCLAEIKEAFEFWYLFAALTERTQVGEFPEPSLELRNRVLSVPRRAEVRPISRRPVVQMWMRAAAGVVLAAGAASLSWNIGRFQIKRDISAAQAQIAQQTAAAKKLESENNALRNLVEAARNAPSVFPGKDAIVSVQDPYMVRDLQRARQTQAAMSDALNQERTEAAELKKRLSQTTTLLAAATRDREKVDRQYQKAFDAMMEGEQGASNLSKELAGYNTKVQNLESQIARYRATIDSRTQLIALLESQTVSLLQLHSTVSGQNASGVALIADDSRLAFFPTNLRAAPAGRTYQLWLIRDQDSAPVSAGTFNGGMNDMPAVQFNGNPPLSRIKALTVTEEPAGGSPRPTGSAILTGTPTKL
jgi:hypothetical protein